ncbi:MAG: hypothetical protein ABIV50_08250 [Opitutus sp.]
MNSVFAVWFCLWITRAYRDIRGSNAGVRLSGLPAAERSHRRQTLEVRWPAALIGLTNDATSILRFRLHGYG